jgi:ABC-2 type transport system permease protein
MKTKLYGKYYKFLTYLTVFILINLAATTLFFRIDLTKNGLYSISDVSKKVVSTLTEPLTIHVFFTKNLPAPYNNVERYLRDLLTEYGIYANTYFNYQFHDVSVKDTETDQNTGSNQQMANNYGIYPVQIQNIEKDEVKFQKAYMGMAMIHGDMIEKIPTITTSEGLEYKITAAIQKMNDKISALLRLKDKIQIKLFLSSSLEIVAPYINISGLSQIPANLEKVVAKLNEKNYGKLTFAHFDPSKDPQARELQQKYNLFRLQWESQKDRFGKEIPGDTGVAGILLEYNQKVQEIQLIQAVNVPLFGTQYKLSGMEKIEQTISDGIENLIDIYDSIGYLNDHGSFPLAGGYGLPNQQQVESISRFNSIVSASYSIQQVNLKKDSIPDNLNCLVISRPKEEFSEYALYQIDQFLMKGKTLAIFLDAFNEIQPARQNQQYLNRNQGPFYIPLKTGLEKLLEHYGVKIKSSYVMDENCYKQRVDQRYGGGEQPIYFAPILQSQFINRQLDFLKQIERLVMVKISPLELVKANIEKFQIDAHTLLSSSDKSWEMSGKINLNPYFISPPQSKDDQKSLPLSYLLEGRFPSYFDGKSIPEKPAEADKEESKKENSDAEDKKKSTEAKEKPAIDLSKLKKDESFLKQSKPAKIFLIASTEILKNNILDEEGKSPNAVFLMNLLDYLNNREDIAVMRSKNQRFNLLEETKSGTKAFFKTFNIIGLPVLVIIFGIIVWIRRKSRKRMIQSMFNK